MPVTVAEITEMLRKADEKEFEALERSLAADTRKGVVRALDVARKRIEAQRAERDRIDGMYRYERELKGDRAGFIVGLDEVGRGPVAGPLAVGAVVLPDEPHILGLNDSKQVAHDVREKLSEQIKAEALAWTVVFVSPQDIDHDGISASLKRAFSQAIAEIDSKLTGVGTVIVDGNPLRIDEREVNVVKGDAKCASVAAASIVAKVARDSLMCELAKEYPAYGFDENKGYGSQQHIEAIKQYGLSPVHRKSFCKSFMQETLF